MFERWTHSARRVIFFARYEASQFGSITIETEHLLLGLLREDTDLLNSFIPRSSTVTIRKSVEEQVVIGEKISTNVDLPLSNECKRILAYATEESERLKHRDIGTAHLLAGILQEENCQAAQILYRHGVRLEAVQDSLARLGSSVMPRSTSSRAVPDAQAAKAVAITEWASRFSVEDMKVLSTVETELKFGVWLVTGSTTDADDTLFAFILAVDGRILHSGRQPVH